MKTTDRMVWKLGISSGLALLYVVVLRLLWAPAGAAPESARPEPAPPERAPPATAPRTTPQVSPPRATRPVPVRVTKRRARVRTRSS